MGLIKEAVIELKMRGVAEAEASGTRLAGSLDASAKAAATAGGSSARLGAEIKAAAVETERVAVAARRVDFTPAIRQSESLKRSLNDARQIIGLGLSAVSLGGGLGQSAAGQAVTGALGGAAMGSAFGPVGTGVGAVLGGLTSYMRASAQEQEAAAREQREAAKAIKDSAAAIERYYGQAPPVGHLGR